MNCLHCVCFFALLFVLVQSYSEDDMAGAVDTCMKANDITYEEYDEFFNTTSSEEDWDNIKRKYKCFVHCLAKEMDIVDSDGYVDMELVEKQGELSKKNWNAFSECKKENDDYLDMCEYAYAFLDCLTEKMDFNDFNNESE
ncbi:hypothetical protein ACLKA7_013627 [Drosophila subpalustris]